MLKNLGLAGVELVKNILNYEEIYVLQYHTRTHALLLEMKVIHTRTFPFSYYETKHTLSCSGINGLCVRLPDLP